MKQVAKGHARNHGGEDELMLESKRYGCLQQEQPEEEEAAGGWGGGARSSAANVPARELRDWSCG